MKKLLLIALAFLTFASVKSFSEDNSPVSWYANLDLVSLYNWRGNDYGNSPAIQPTIGMNYAPSSSFNLDFSFWGSQALTANVPTASINGFPGEKKMYNEIDLTGKANFKLGDNGSLSLIAIDFFYPYSGAKFSNYKDYDSPTAGAHVINVGFEYDAPEKCPWRFAMDYAIHNDKDAPLYAELGYSFDVKGLKVIPVLGFTKQTKKCTDPLWAHTYFLDSDNPFKPNTSRISCVNLGVTVQKTIKVTNDFSVPMSGQIVLNPYTEKAYFIAKISF